MNPCGCALGQADDERIGMYADLAGVGVAFLVIGVLGYFVMRGS